MMKNITQKVVWGVSVFIVGMALLAGCSDSAPKGTGQETEATAKPEPAANNADLEISADPMKNKGIGPVKKVTLGAIDNGMAKKGQEIFDAKCSACHKFDKRYVGPAVGGVTERRTPEWIMNQILNPVEMSQKDPIAKDLLATYLTQMAFQDVSESEARELLEYFRQQDAHSTK